MNLYAVTAVLTQSVSTGMNISSHAELYDAISAEEAKGMHLTFCQEQYPDHQLSSMPILEIFQEMIDARVSNKAEYDAAPELLDALQAALDFGLDDFKSGEQEVYAKMKAAIAKATGAGE